MTTSQFNRSAVFARQSTMRSTMSGFIAILAACALAASAAAAPASHHPHHKIAAAGDRPETVEQRIMSLHAALQITPDEETGWQRVTDVMRHNDATMRAMKADPELGAAVKSNAVDDLKTYEKFNQAHVNGLAELIPAFATLYAAMPHTQQVLADGVFRKFGRGDVKMHG